MKKMITGALALGATCLLASGCIIVSGDDDPIDGDINVSWSIDPACPVGATTAQLIARPPGAPTSAGIPATFDCDAGSGFIEAVPPGTYDVFVNITDTSTNTLFAQSFAQADVVVVAGREVTVAPFTILADEAFFGFDWQITEGGSLAPDCAVPVPSYPDPDCNAGGALVCPPASTCASDGICRVDATRVGFVATFVSDTSVPADSLFECTPEGSGQAGPFPLGDYSDVIISITDPAGASYYDSNAMPTAALDVGNEIEDLGTVVFPL